MASVMQGGNRTIKLMETSTFNQALMGNVVFLRTWKPVLRNITHSYGKNTKKINCGIDQAISIFNILLAFLQSCSTQRWSE